MPTIFSLVIPAYNEASRIRPTLRDYSAYFGSKFKDGEYEILVILNGCTDNTLEVVNQEIKENTAIKVYDIKESIGKGGALTEGLSRASGKYIGYTDADGSTSGSELYKLFKILESNKGYDCVIGSRALKDSVVTGKSAKRKVMSKIFNLGVNLLFNLKIKDTQCAAKITTKKMIEVIKPNLSIANMAFDVNFLVDIKRAGGKIKETPITWQDKQGSTVSAVNSTFKTSLAMTLSVVRLKILYSPLRFIYPIIRPITYPIYFFLVNDRYKVNYEKWKVSHKGKHVKNPSD